MEYKKASFASEPSNPIQKTKTTFIWGSDGWCYVPELKLRQKYTENRYLFDSWEGVIAPPLNIETVDWYLYSQAPRCWREVTGFSDEIFEETTHTKALPE
jgi:hypothetical protein